MKKSTVDGAWITAVIEEIVATSAENTLNLPTGEKAFDAPLVGFSNGADPLLNSTCPTSAIFISRRSTFNKSFPREKTVAPGDLTVISWVLPSSSRTRNDQAAAVRRPCERWVMVRHYGELFNESLRRSLVARLSEAGDSGQWRPCSNLSGASPTRDRMHRAPTGRNGMRPMPRGSVPSGCATD